MPSRVAKLIAPADSPKIVTLSGSPPNAAMFVAHPFERGDLVEDAGVAGAGELGAEAVGEVQEAERRRAGS